MKLVSIYASSHPVVISAAAKCAAGALSSSTKCAANRIRPAWLIAIGLALCSTAFAQTAHFAGTESLLPLTGAAPAPAGIAVDASGNVFISDYANKQVLKETPGAAGYTATTIATGFGGPAGIAVDTADNVYVADLGGQQLFQVPVSSSSPTGYGSPVALLTGTYSPADVTVNQFGHAFFTNMGDTAVYSVLASGGPSAPSAVGPLAGLLQQPLGIAWQPTGNGASGNLFVSDFTQNEVVELSWSGGGWGTVQTVPTNGLSAPARIAVGGDGSLYVADYGNKRVVKEPWTGIGFGTQTTVQTTKLSQPQAVGVDLGGNVYVGDFGNNRVLKETIGGFNFGAVAVGTPSSAVTYFFHFDAAVNAGTPKVLTQGAAGQDFAATGAGTCSAQSYSAGNVCTVTLTFTPLFAGFRKGAVVLQDSGGNAIATAYTSGLGSGPQLAFGPGTTSTLVGSGLSGPEGAAVDGNGTLYIVNNGASQVVEVPLGGTPASILTGLTDPRGIAVDGAGNLFIAESSSGSIVEAPAGCTKTACLITLTSSLTNPQGIAVDGQGNVFASEDGTKNDAVEIPWTGAAYGSPVVVVSSLDSPGFLTVDASGNLYIANTGGNSIVEAFSGASYAVSTTLLSTGLSGPAGVAVDASGNLYISDQGNKRVVWAPWTGAGFGTPIPLASVGASGIALDGAGNLYLSESDAGGKLALEVDLADAPSLSFQSTMVTGTSSDSARTVTVANVGNQTLQFTGSGTDPVYPVDFPENTGDLNVCAAGTTLAPAATCDLSVNFTPTVTGNLSEYLVLTDNNLIWPGPGFTTQSILLSGTGTPQPTVQVAPLSLPFGNQIQGTTSNPLMLVLSNTSSIALNNIALGWGATNPNSIFAIQSQSTTCTATLQPYSTCIILVTFTPTATGDASDFYSATLQIADDAVGNPQTVSATGSGIPPTVLLSPSSVNFGTQTVSGTSPGQTVILSNTSSGTLSITGFGVTETDSNPPAFKISSSTCANLPAGQNSTLQLGANSSCTITMTFTPGSATSYAGQLAVTDNGLGGTQTVTLTGTGAGQNVFLSSTAVNFGNQTVLSTSNATTITFNNTSNLPVTGVGVSIGVINPTDFGETTTCTATLAAYSTCNIMVTFTPQSAASFTGSLIVASSAGTQTSVLSGTGTLATSALAPAQLNFGNVMQSSASSAQVATLTNTSNGPLTISGVTVSAGSTNFSINSNACASGSTLPANASCSISVIFTPQGVGNFTGTLKVTDTGAGSPLTASLVGTGTSSAASAYFSPAAINFGNQTVGSTGNAWGVTLNNTGGGSMTGLSLATSSTNFTISSNNCGNSLAANSVCSFQLEFTPTAQGNLSGVVTATYTGGGSGGAGGSLSALLSGVGIVPTVSIAPSSLNFANQLQGTTGTPQVATLTNTSAGPVSFPTSGSMTILGNSSDFTIQSSNCPNPLPAGASCTISVAFNPQGAAAYTGTLLVTDSAGSSPQTVALTGTGTSNAPSGVFSPASIAFGNQTLKSSSNPWGMTLTNNGNVAIQVGSPFTVSGTVSGDFTVSSNNCASATLAVGAACSFQVTFTPQAVGAQSGSITAPISFTPSGGSAINASITASLTGTGTAPTISVSPSSINFGNVIQGVPSGDQTVTLSNTSAGPVSITSIGAGSPFAVDSVNPPANACVLPPATSTLAANSSCSINVTYTPSTVGSQSGTLTIADNAGSGLQTVSLTGTGTSNTPTGYFSPVSINFGNQTLGTASNAWGMTLNNNSNVTMQGLGVSVSGTAFSIVFGSNTCTTSLAAGAACSFQVTFAPGTTLGSQSGTVTAQFNNGSGQVNSITAGLTGMGIAPTVSVSPSSINFGNVILNSSSSDQFVTLTNTSAGSVTYSGVGFSGPFGAGSTLGTCAAGPVAVGTSCTISVKYTPTAVGNQSGTLTINDTAGSGQQTVSLSGTGLSNTPGGVFSPSSINFGNVTLGTTSNAWGMTFTNTGNVTLQTLSVSASTGFSIPSGTNTCTAPLTAGAACGFQVTFSPGTTLGSQAGTVTASFGSGSTATNSITASLTGTGVAPTVAVSPSSINFGNAIEGSQTSDQVVTVTNTSAGPVSFSGVPTASGPFTVDSLNTTCAGTLPASHSCIVSVYYTASAAGNQNGTLTISDNATGGSQTVSLSGVGISNTPNGVFSPSSISFGNQTLGTTTNAAGITFTNIGNVALQNLSISVPTAAGFATVPAIPCAASLGVGATCSFQVTFTPGSMIAQSGTVKATFNSGGSSSSVSVTASLTGTGVAPTVSVSPSSINFGSIIQGNAASDQVVTVTNQSAGPVTFSGFSAGLGGPFYVDTGASTCSTSTALAANHACSISVYYSPSATGSVDGALTISDNATGSPQTVALNGMGVSNTPSGAFSPSSLGFGNQTLGSTSNAAGMTFRNTGNVPLVSFSVTASAGFSISPSTPCPTTLGVGGSCNFQVTFAPGTTLGAQSGNVTATFNNASGASPSTLSINAGLTGTGVAPTVSVSPSSVNFGNVSYGSSSSEHVLTLTNTSAGQVSSIALSAGSPFSVDASASTCSSGTLAPWGSCTISVYYTPSAAATQNGTLTITDTAAGGVQTVPLNGVGTAEAQTISFSSLAGPVTYGQGSPAISLSATATSSLPVTFSLVSGPGTVSNSTLTITGAGTVVVAANQSGNANYAPAPQVTQSLTVNKATAFMSAAPSATAINAGQQLSSSTLTGGTASATIWGSSISIPGAFSWTTPGITPSATAQENVTFTPTDTTDYNTNPAAGTVTVTVKVAPSITLNCTPASLTYTGAAQSVTCTAAVGGTATGNVTMYWRPQGSPSTSNTPLGVATLSGGSAQVTGVIGTSAGSYTVEADYAGDSNYIAISSTTTATIGKATPTVTTWPTASALVSGEQLGSSTFLTAGAASVPGTFTWIDPGTVLNTTGTITESVLFTPTDSADFIAITGSAQVTVNQDGSQIIGSSSSNYAVTASQTSVTVQSGQNASVGLALVPTSGFAGTVAFSCSNLPAGVSCTFNPKVLTADGHGTVQTSQLTIATAGANSSTASANREQTGPSGTALASIFMFPSILFGGILAWRRRKLSNWAKQLLLAGILISTLIGFTGCGGVYFKSAPLGTVNITVTATATATGGATTTQTGVLTVTITQ